jgi:hypothetical protein
VGVRGRVVGAVGDNGDLGTTFLKIKNRIGFFPLRKEGFFLFKLEHRPPYACFGQKLNRTECSLLLPIHRQGISAHKSTRRPAVRALRQKVFTSGNQNSGLIAPEILRRLSKSSGFGQVGAIRNTRLCFYERS